MFFACSHIFLHWLPQTLALKWHVGLCFTGMILNAIAAKYESERENW